MDIPKGIAEKEAALFARWIKTTDKNFVVDGVVDEPTFLQQECRLIFLLKEANQMGRTALPEFLRNGAPENGGHTWNPVCRWLTGDESRAFTPQERSKILRKVAVINLKKEDGGSRTNLNDIRAAVEKDKEFIKEQLSFYAEASKCPVVFVCCGPGLLSILNDHVLGNLKINRNAPLSYIKPDENQEVYYIAFNHPNCRKAGMVKQFAKINDIVMTGK